MRNDLTDGSSEDGEMVDEQPNLGLIFYVVISAPFLSGAAFALWAIVNMTPKEQLESLPPIAGLFFIISYGAVGFFATLFPMAFILNNPGARLHSDGRFIRLAALGLLVGPTVLAYRFSQGMASSFGFATFAVTVLVSLASWWTINAVAAVALWVLAGKNK